MTNKVLTSFTASHTDHGGQAILALTTPSATGGAIVLPLGYTVYEVFNGGGNPYGATYTSETRVGQPDPHTVACAVAQGGRLAWVSGVVASAQDRGLPDIRRRVVAESETRPGRT